MRRLTLAMVRLLRAVARDELPPAAWHTTTRNALIVRGFITSYSLTDRGRRVAALLGEVPRDPWGEAWASPEFCRACERYVPMDMVAWGEADGAPDARPPLCIDCAARRDGLTGGAG